jgi:hypothetical protein
MSLQSVPVAPAIRKQLISKLQGLVEEQVLKISGRAATSVKPSFRMAIQLVRSDKLQELTFGKPEGLRVLVTSKSKTIAAVDFLFEQDDLKLLHIYQGKALFELVDVLQKLKQEYRNHKTIYHIQLISFVPAPGFYLMLTSKNERHFYKTAHQLNRLSIYQLQEELKELVREKQQAQKK